MNTLHAMRAFCAVVDLGSFARAAEQLDISTTATSRLVADLEKHLGAQLLQRSTRRLNLTETGAAYFERCRQILADIEEAEAGASASDAAPRGLLRINLPQTFGLRYVAPLIPEFCRRYPDLRLEVSFSDQMIELVEEGVDMAIRIALELKTNLIARHLAPIRIISCASPDYLAQHGAPKTLDDLRRHHCLSYSYAPGGDTWRFLQGGKPHSIQVKPSFRANSGDMIRLAALAGQGIANQPSFIVGDDLRAGRLVRVLPDYEIEDRQAWAVYLPGSRRSARVIAFYEFLKEAFGDTPPWDR